MNHWRAQSRAATPELLLLVKEARELFAEWTYALQGGEDETPDAGGITARARELRGEPAEAPQTPPATREVPAEQSAAAPAIAPSAPDVPQQEFMTGLLPVTEPAAPKEEKTLSPAEQCDQALADLGDRLKWINGLIEEIGTQTSGNALANSRLHEIAHMLQESMAEADALHRALADHVAELKKTR
jgi:hypothetical protein